VSGSCCCCCLCQHRPRTTAVRQLARAAAWCRPQWRHQPRRRQWPRPRGSPVQLSAPAAPVAPAELLGVLEQPAREVQGRERACLFGERPALVCCSVLLLLLLLP
jgi:hypothetical protein